HRPRLAHEPPAGFLHRPERLGQEVVQRLAVGEALLEFRRLGREIGVAEIAVRFEVPVDLVHDRPQLLLVAVVLVAEDSRQQSAYHLGLLFLSSRKTGCEIPAVGAGLSRLSTTYDATRRCSIRRVGWRRARDDYSLLTCVASAPRSPFCSSNSTR